MIKDTYIAPEKGMVLPKATAKDMAMAASVVPNDSLSEEFRVQMDGKDKVYQDLDDVENAAHTLHYKLLKKTSAYQSFGLVSEVVGGAVGRRALL